MSMRDFSKFSKTQFSPLPCICNEDYHRSSFGQSRLSKSTSPLHLAESTCIQTRGYSMNAANQYHLLGWICGRHTISHNPDNARSQGNHYSRTPGAVDYLGTKNWTDGFLDLLGEIYYTSLYCQIPFWSSHICASCQRAHLLEGKSWFQCRLG